MKIIKSLNLNKTPQEVDNNSLIFAKNIKLSKDKQYLTNEESLLDAAIFDSNNESIRGVIATNVELVVFVYTNNTNKINIYRIKETPDGYSKTKVESAWNYQGGEISGTFTYNVNNELIIAIAENNNGVDIPLKTINLDTCKSSDNENLYNIAPNVPICICNLTEVIKGNMMPIGVYYLFIRYELDNDVFTKWFPIGKPYIAHNVEPEQVITHRFPTDDAGKTATVNLYQYVINENRDTSNNFSLSIRINNKYKYNKFQIGYILQHDNSTVARTWKKFSIDTRNIIFDAANPKEYNIDDLLENTFNIYNVKNICNYNNRLYIANYKETDINVDLEYYANNIIPKITLNEISFSINKDLNQISNSVNISTLLPGQPYNFFVHYVKSDGSFTNGIRIVPKNVIREITYDKTYNLSSYIRDLYITDTSPDWLKYLYNSNYKDYRLCEFISGGNGSNFGVYVNSEGVEFFQTLVSNDHSIPRIIPYFNNITIPPNYVGAFISFEKVEYKFQYIGLVEATIAGAGEPSSFFNILAADAQNGDIPYSGNIYTQTYRLGINSSPTLGNKKPIIINSIDIYKSDNPDHSKGRNGYIYVTTKLPISGTNGAIVGDTREYSFLGDVCLISSTNDKLYLNSNKELIRLGGIILGNGTYNESSAGDFFLDGYVGIDESIVYDKRGVVISENGDVKFLNGGVPKQAYANNFYFLKYSRIPLTVKNIKNAPDVLAVSKDDNITINKVIFPSKLSDLIEYKNTYKPKEYKAYINYDKFLISRNEFTKTIRRSDVIQTESIENSWRNFRPNAYKVISENKGKITNLAGVGLYLLVHTEHSLFMFNRDASMKTENKDVQLYIPDAFDVSYQEVFTSEKGYGGLKDSLSYLINENGYTFYDNDSTKIYNFDNGALNIISNDIAEFIEYAKPTVVRFVTDYNNNRILICIRNKNDDYATLSYNFETKSFISLHDYYFNFGMNTKQHCYLSSSRGYNIKTFRNSTGVGNYGNLKIINDNFFPAIKESNDNIRQSIIDVIFNAEYETIKELDFISYILNNISSYKSYSDNQAETSQETYSGYRLLLYTDQTKTPLIDISKGSTNHKNYKYPYFNKGVWNLNYFRNYVEGTTKSNDLSLIYGKYIVARFIFDNTNGKIFKLENVEFNVNKY